MISTHRSSAFVKSIAERGRAWKPDPITAQFRFIVRMAVACHDLDVPYDLAWALDGKRMRPEPGQSVISHGVDRDLSLDEALPGGRL